MKMINKLRLLWGFLCIFIVVPGTSQTQPEAYRLYDGKGRVVDYDQLVKTIAKVDVVFIGEIHNCVITHWLELKLLDSLYKIQEEYLQPIITQYFIDNKSEIWLLFLIAHSKR